MLSFQNCLLCLQIWTTILYWRDCSDLFIMLSIILSSRASSDCINGNTDSNSSRFALKIFNSLTNLIHLTVKYLIYSLSTISFIIVGKFTFCVGKLIYKVRANELFVWANLNVGKLTSYHLAYGSERKFKIQSYLILCILLPCDLRVYKIFSPGGGGHSLIWPVRGHAAGQGMVFGLLCPEQGIQFYANLS